MASTPLEPRVAAEMIACLQGELCLGNPAASHCYGKQASDKIEIARAQVAKLIHAAPREIIFTSGATEANNIAIRGAAYARGKEGRHIITSQIEHKAVLDVCQSLEKEGFILTYLPVDREGRIDLELFIKSLRPDTTLVSLMHVNNEIGVINDIQAIAGITQPRKIWLHVDAAQSAGKIPIDLSQTPVDLMSFSAHKVYGPKGVGALYVRLRPRVRLTPILWGGGQEQGLRPGTLATHQIVGMGEAFNVANELMMEEGKRIASLRKKFWNGVSDLPDLKLNGDSHQRVNHNLNICFAGLSHKEITEKLQALAISKGSACNTFSPDRSHVLRAIGLSSEEIDCTRRFSIGRFTTEQEIDFAILCIREMYQ
ncbi:MAG: aminotransferase class V-fold PLP-dependent enzyme [Legionellales bacterium]|nr:aminotransferase class V-fold PLP-dependent enzyme [Legionellales bacterium]